VIAPTVSKHPFLPEHPGIRVKALKACANEVWTGQNQNVWVDVESPTSDQIKELEKVFGFNRLALEDALERGHWARFEVYPEHVFLIFRTLAEPEDVTDRTERVSFFWYPELKSLITFRNEPVTYLENVWHEMDSRKDRSPVDIMYALLQRGADTFFTFVDELESRTDELEERVFVGKLIPGSAASFASEVFELKHTMISARRLVSGARETVAQFARHATMLSPEGAILFRDVTDHLARVYDGLDSARDVLTSLLDVHLSVQSNRMNEVMKTLTIVSTVFLPLTFLAGVWGMNFRIIPELSWPLGYAFAWAMFALVGVGFAWYFKRRGWW
jgi:magnesium transporter